MPKSPMLLSRDKTAHSLQHELEINTVQGPKNWGGGSMRCRKTWPQHLSPRRLCSWQLWGALLVPFRSCAAGILVAWSLPKPGRNSKASTVLGSHFFEGLLSLPSLPLSLERWLFGSLPSLIVDDIWEHVAKVCYSWMGREVDLSSNVSGLSAQSCAALGPFSETELYFSWRPFRMMGCVCWRFQRVVTRTLQGKMAIWIFLGWTQASTFCRYCGGEKLWMYGTTGASPRSSLSFSLSAFLPKWRYNLRWDGNMAPLSPGRYCLRRLLCSPSVWACRLVLALCILRTKLPCLSICPCRGADSFCSFFCKANFFCSSSKLRCRSTYKTAAGPMSFSLSTCLMGRQPEQCVRVITTAKIVCICECFPVGMDGIKSK